MIDLKYVVVGTGRCASVYMARLLSSLGIPCGHECCFDWRGIDYAKAKLSGALAVHTSETSQYTYKDGVHTPVPKWLDESKIVAESSYMAVPYLKQDVFAKTKVIHVVRNPVKVVNSFIRYLEYFQNRHPAFWMPAKRYETFIYSHCTDLYFDMTQEERAALYVLKWNKMIEEMTTNMDCLFHRAEDDPQAVIDFVGTKRPETLFDDKKVNTYEKRKKPFTLDQLPSGRIKDEFIAMGRRYGYTMGLESEQFLT